MTDAAPDSVGAGVGTREGPACAAAPVAAAGVEPAAADRSCIFAFEVPGEPIPKARPRASMVNGHATLYTPKKTRSYEDRVRQAALLHWTREPLRECEITLFACFFLPVPASWSKRKQAAARAGDRNPAGKPDLDNLVKAVTDGLNGVVFHDDAAIVETRCAKRYHDNPRVIVSLSWKPQT